MVVVSFLSKGDTRAEAYRQHLQGKTLDISCMTVAGHSGQPIGPGTGYICSSTIGLDKAQETWYCEIDRRTHTNVAPSQFHRTT